MATKHDLMAVMVHHCGKSKGISCSRLAGLLDIPERRVRQLVTELRDDATAICGQPSTGYFIAQTHEEMEATLDFLKDRALHSLKLHSKLSGLPLADLIGQLHLRT